MKKFTSLVLALMVLSLCAVAGAEAIPSKTTADMTEITVKGENLPEDSGFYIRPVEEDEEAYAELLALCADELEALAAAETPEAYFGDVVSEDGALVDLKASLDVEALSVNEFFPLIAGNYEDAFGDITVTLKTATPYAAGENVIVLLGFEAEDAIQWVAVPGAAEAEGEISFILSGALVKAIEANSALLAVISK